MYKKFRIMHDINYEVTFKSSKTKSDGSVLLKNATVKEVKYGNNGFVKIKDVSLKKFEKNLTSAIAAYNHDKTIDETLAKPGQPNLRRKVPEVPVNIGDVQARQKNALWLQPNSPNSPNPLKLKEGKLVVNLPKPLNLKAAGIELNDILDDGEYDYKVAGLPTETATITTVKNSAGKPLHKLVKVSAPVEFNAASPTYTTSVFNALHEFTSTDSRSNDAFLGDWYWDASLKKITYSSTGYDLIKGRYISVTTEITKILTGYKIDSFSNKIKIQSAVVDRRAKARVP